MIALKITGIILYFLVAYIFYRIYLPNCQGGRTTSLWSDILLAVIAMLWLPGIILLILTLFVLLLYLAFTQRNIKNKTNVKGNL